MNADRSGLVDCGPAAQGGKAADGGPETPKPRAALAILALAAVFLAVLPARDAGFLADDFYIVQKIAERSDAGAWSAIRDAFVHRWTAEFDVFRPLTILTLQADFAIHGAGGRRFHVTNIGLWLACTALAGAVAARFPRSPAPAWTGMLLFGLSGACAESVGWIVAREDLLLAASALLALRLFLGAPGRPLAWTLALVPGFLAKETAILLPPLLLWTDLVLRPGPGVSLSVRLRRHGGAFLLLAAYFGIRFLLFGRFGGTYGGRPFGDHLARPDLLQHVLGAVGESAGRLAAPVNHSAWERSTGLPAALPVAASAVLVALLLAAGIRRGAPEILRAALAALPWIAGPLALLVIPLDGVDRDLRLGRFLVLPLAGWLLPLAASAARGGRAARIVVLVSAALGIAIVRSNLDTFVQATRCAEGLMGDITSIVPPGGRAFLLGAGPAAGGPGLHDDLVWHEGAHLLSAGLFHATLPPFVPPPGIAVEVVTRGGEAAALARPDLASTRTAVLRFEPGRPCPRFALVAPAGHPGFRPILDPPHGADRGRTWEPRFRAYDPFTQPSAQGRVRIVVTDLAGQQAVAEKPAAEVLDSFGGWTFEAPGATFCLRTPGGVVLDHPLSSEILRAIQDPVLLWWVEIENPPVKPLRSPPAAIVLR